MPWAQYMTHVFATEPLTVQALYEIAQRRQGQVKTKLEIDEDELLGQHTVVIFPFPALEPKNPLPIGFTICTMRHGSSLTSLILNANPHLYAPQGPYMLCFQSLKHRAHIISQQPLFLEEVRSRAPCR